MTTLTTAERAVELFGQRPTDENRIDWLANQLLALAAESQFLSLRLVRTDEGDGAVLECSDSAHVVVSTDPGPLRLFRTLLARLAKMAEQENGTEFNPYGGKLHFDRPSADGPVRLNVEFANTTQTQSIMCSAAASGFEGVSGKTGPANALRTQQHLIQRRDDFTRESLPVRQGMNTNYSEVADQFITQVRATKITPTTEVNIVYFCVDDQGNEITPFRMELVGRTTVSAPGNLDWAKQFAAAAHLDTIIDNINSLIRTATPESFSRPREAPKIPMRLVRMELEIRDV